MRGLQRAVWTSRPYVALRRVGGRATRPLRRVEIGVVFRRDLAKPLPELPAAAPIVVSLATPEEAAGEVADLKRPLDPALHELFRERMERGFTCFIARIDGKLVAYNWIQHHPGEDDGDFIDLRPGEAHMLDAYTVEEWRGKNIHGSMNRDMLAFLRERGYRYSYSKASALNFRSPKALRRLGWEVTGVVLRARRSRGKPVIRLRGSAHPWTRLRT